MHRLLYSGSTSSRVLNSVAHVLSNGPRRSAAILSKVKHATLPRFCVYTLDADMLDVAVQRMHPHSIGLQPSMRLIWTAP